MPVLSTAIGLGLAAGSAVAGAVGKKSAANAQQQGAEQAQQLEAQNQQKAIDYQNQQLKTEQQQQQPYVDAGSQGLNSLRSLLSTPGQGLLQNYDSFQAPTLEQAEQTPGYQFNEQQGVKALDTSASAKGNLFSGTQGTALEEFGQGLAQNTYQQAYQNALNSYNTNGNTFYTNQNNQFSRLGQLAGVGQQATNVLTGAEQSAAGNVGNVLVNGAQQQAQQVNNAAAARASGYRGVGDELAGGLTYGANWLSGENANQVATYQANQPFYDPTKYVNQGGSNLPPNYATLPPPQIPGVNQF